MADARHTLRHMAGAVADAVRETLAAWVGADAVDVVAANVIEDGSSPYAGIAFPAAAVTVEYSGAAGGGTVLVVSPGAAAAICSHMLGESVEASPEQGVSHLTELQQSALSEVTNQVLAAAAAQLGRALAEDVEIGPAQWARPGSAEIAAGLLSVTPYSTVIDIRVFGRTCTLVTQVPHAFVVRMGSVIAEQAHDLVDQAMRAHAQDRHATPASAVGLEGVRVELTVELGRARIPLSELANLAPGNIVQMAERHDEPFLVCANGAPIAEGRLVREPGGRTAIEVTRRCAGADGIAA